MTTHLTSNNYFYNKLHTHPIKTRDELHKTYSGRIYTNDFNADYRGKDERKGSPIASRIASDFRWEEGLRNNYDIRGKRSCVSCLHEKT